MSPRRSTLTTTLLASTLAAAACPCAGAPDAAAAEFQTICNAFKDSYEPFYGERRARDLSLMLENDSLDTAQAVALQRALGWEHLKLGKPLEAIAVLESALATAGGAEAEPSARVGLLALLVLSHLQAAEDENCIAHHTSDSCIVPLREGGVHRLPKHARIAGDLSLEMLHSQGPQPQVAWVLNLARMASGAYPHGVPEKYRLPADAFAIPEGFPRWLDRAPELGVNAVDLAGGAIMDDFDGDGLMDLVSSTCDPCGSLKAFRNDGRGGFEDVTAAWGLDAQLGGLNLVHADYDNDGWLDLLVLRGGWLHEHGRVRNSLLRNRLVETGRFEDVTRAAGLAEPAYPTQTGAWADYDSDGDLDLYVGNEGSAQGAYPSQLFRNDGDGRFTDVAESAGVINERYTKGVAWGDYDNDGDPDLYVSTNNTPNRLYRNEGNGAFTDVAGTTGVTLPAWRSFATWFFDYDNDGWLDLFVGNFENPPAKMMASYFGERFPDGASLVYRNRQGRGFDNVSGSLGITRPALPMGANYGDLDNDGWLDFYLGTGEPAYEAQVPNLMYRNLAGARFTEITYAGGFGHLQKGHGVAFGDVDNDGDQDLFHQLGGFYPGDTFGNALFENPGGSAHWVTLRLRGVEANRFGVGARIAIRVGEGAASRTIHALAGSGGSFGGSSMQQEIGLGRASRIEELVITWPGSGTVQRWRAVEPDRVYDVVEGEDTLRRVSLPEIRLGADEQKQTDHQHDS